MKKTLGVLITLFILVGCSSQVSEKVIETATPQPTMEITPTLLSTPTEEKCIETRGRFEFIEVPSELMSYPMEVRIYLPACYDQEPEVKVSGALFFARTEFS